MTVECDLQGLLVDLTGLDPKAAEQLARELYRDLYLNKGRVGIHQTHDNQELVFHEDAFDHAFFTTSDPRCHPERKDALRNGSIERIRWIGRLISGHVRGSACFEVPSPTGRLRPPNRLYAIFETPFVVWLEPRRDGGWKFSTAYALSLGEINNYRRGGRTVWRYKENGPMI